MCGHVDPHISCAPRPYLSTRNRGRIRSAVPPIFWTRKVCRPPDRPSNVPAPVYWRRRAVGNDTPPGRRIIVWLSPVYTRRGFGQCLPGRGDDACRPLGHDPSDEGLSGPDRSQVRQWSVTSSLLGSRRISRRSFSPVGNSADRRTDRLRTFRRRRGHIPSLRSQGARSAGRRLRAAVAPDEACAVRRVLLHDRVQARCSRGRRG